MFPFFIVDLTHTLSPDIPTWSGSPAIEYNVLVTHEQCTKGTEFLALRYMVGASSGTHIDAPLHCVRTGHDVSQIALENLVRPLVVIRVPKQGRSAVTVDEILCDEKLFGSIAPGSIVCFDTGWGNLFKNSAAYRNVQEDGSMAFPYLEQAAAEYLAQKDIIAVGIDTLSPDCPISGSFEYPVHDIFLPKGILIIENLAHLDRVPRRGSFIGIFPLKIAGGAESPVRAVAFVTHDTSSGVNP